MLAKNETKKHGNLETNFRPNMKQADFIGFSKFSFGTLFDPCCNFRTFCDRFQNAFYFRKVVSYWELGKYREQITYGKNCEIQEGGILQQTRNAFKNFFISSGVSMPVVLKLFEITYHLMFF